MEDLLSVSGAIVYGHRFRLLDRIIIFNKVGICLNLSKSVRSKVAVKESFESFGLFNLLRCASNLPAPSGPRTKCEYWARRGSWGTFSVHFVSVQDASPPPDKRSSGLFHWTRCGLDCCAENCSLCQEFNMQCVGRAIAYILLERTWIRKDQSVGGDVKKGFLIGFMTLPPTFESSRVHFHSKRI